jgi:hypothetical protein
VECGGARANDCFLLGCFATALSSSPDPDPWDVDVASGVCGGGRDSRARSLVESVGDVSAGVEGEFNFGITLKR